VDKLTFKQLKKFGSPKATKHLEKEGKQHGGKLIKSAYGFALPMPTPLPQPPHPYPQVIGGEEYIPIDYAAKLLGITKADIVALAQEGVLQVENYYYVAHGTFIGASECVVRRSDVMHLRLIEEAEEKAKHDQQYEQGYYYLGHHEPFHGINLAIQTEIAQEDFEKNFLLPGNL
jgi:hypothetical protein